MIKIQVELTEEQVAFLPALVEGNRRAAADALESGSLADLELVARGLCILHALGQAVVVSPGAGKGQAPFHKKDSRTHKHLYGAHNGICSLCQSKRQREPRKPRQVTVDEVVAGRAKPVEPQGDAE
jgi:hypothetical protein